VQSTGSHPPQERAKRVVKRYSNRKLYDTRESRYVTLLQIAEMVRAGEEVQIIDNATKDDLTEVTLAQIIYEEQKQHSRSVPLATLRDLIHQRGERLMTQLREGPLGRLLPGEKVGEDGKAVPDEHGTYGGTPAKEEPKKDETEKKGIFKELDERIRHGLASFSPFQQLQSEVARLKERIEELESKLRSKGETPNSGPQSSKPTKKE